MRYIQPSKSERPARCTFKRTVCLAVCVLTVIGLTGAAAWSLHSVPRLHSIVTNICSNRNSTTCMDEALHILKDILKLLNSDAFRLSPPSTKPVSPSAWQMVRDNGLPYSQCQISAGLYCNCSVELPENNTLTPPTDLFSTQGFDPATAFHPPGTPTSGVPCTGLPAEPCTRLHLLPVPTFQWREKGGTT